VGHHGEITRNMKKFTGRQVFYLVFAIVAGIAFVETSSPVWTMDFWREFLLKLIIYSVVSEFMVLVVGKWIEKRR